VTECTEWRNCTMFLHACMASSPLVCDDAIVHSIPTCYRQQVLHMLRPQVDVTEYTFKLAWHLLYLVFPDTDMH
jgi:hypothetical protein